MCYNGFMLKHRSMWHPEQVLLQNPCITVLDLRAQCLLIWKAVSSEPSIYGMHWALRSVARELTTLQVTSEFHLHVVAKPMISSSDLIYLYIVIFIFYCMPLPFPFSFPSPPSVLLLLHPLSLSVFPSAIGPPYLTLPPPNILVIIPLYHP